jgi:transmembrane sensor
MEYLDYSVEDFLADEHFQQWVLFPDENKSRFWENWLQQHPEKQIVVENARKILKKMALQENPVIDNKRIEKLWQRIETTKNREFSVTTARLSKPKQIWLLSRYQSIAAVCTILLTGILLYYTVFRPVEMVEYKTAFGKTRTIVLPDQSRVMLNSNSSIRYASHWDEDEPRQVWVEGEAYFSVVHTQNHQKFSVKTSSGMDVEVLGTEFNVKNRKSGTQVVLQSGKVKLLIQQKETTRQVLMEPSESVELANTTIGYVKRNVDPQQFLSWTQNKLIFKNTSIAQIKTILEETYGLTVNIPDTSLLNQKITGSVPSNSIESLLFVLSESFNYTIIKENNQLLFLEKH